MKIVARKRIKGDKCNNPTSVLNILCDEIGLSNDFLFKGVQHSSYRRKLKKKIDNIIAEAKKAEINPTHYKTEIEDDFHYICGEADSSA